LRVGKNNLGPTAKEHRSGQFYSDETLWDSQGAKIADDLARDVIAGDASGAAAGVEGSKPLPSGSVIQPTG
jgi:hypothetical protein